MASSTSWVYALRAETLAKLYLTRSRDLDILTLSESTNRVQYDLLVRVNGVGTIDTPEFGVEVKGISQPLESNRWRSTVLRNLARWWDRSEDETTDQHLPICLFVFNIDTEEGLYLWLREPHVEQNGYVKAYLSTNLPEGNGRQKTAISNGVRFEKLDKVAIDRIVDKVVEWYRARDRLLRQANGLAENSVPIYGKP
ncbi:MAG TPA: hypothetical protein VH482_25525 [Thermomicrobiales bacterium]|jgi:hypothetical protein